MSMIRQPKLDDRYGSEQGAQVFEKAIDLELYPETILGLETLPEQHRNLVYFPLDIVDLRTVTQGYIAVARDRVRDGEQHYDIALAHGEKPFQSRQVYNIPVLQSESDELPDRMWPAIEACLNKGYTRSLVHLPSKRPTILDVELGVSVRDTPYKATTLNRLKQGSKATPHFWKNLSELVDTLESER